MKGRLIETKTWNVVNSYLEDSGGTFEFGSLSISLTINSLQRKYSVPRDTLILEVIIYYFITYFF